MAWSNASRMRQRTVTWALQRQGKTDGSTICAVAHSYRSRWRLETTLLVRLGLDLGLLKMVFIASLRDQGCPWSWTMVTSTCMSILCSSTSTSTSTGPPRTSRTTYVLCQVPYLWFWALPGGVPGVRTPAGSGSGP